jgi:hypothetical protein
MDLPLRFIQIPIDVVNRFGLSGGICCDREYGEHGQMNGAGFYLFHIPGVKNKLEG